MPRKIPTFRPVRPRQRENRPSSTARGYGSVAWRRTRLAVIARDMGVCQLCGRLIVSSDGREHHIDHIVEKSAGGTDAMDNLRLVHRECHSRRHALER